jgi:hypothetical protein
LLPARLRDDEPSRGQSELPLTWQIFGGRVQSEVLRPRSNADTFPVARLAADPDHPPRYLVPAPDDAG